MGRLFFYYCSFRHLLASSFRHLLTFITCRLHANAVHGLIAESSPPFSIHIQVHAWFVAARFTFSPGGKLQIPAVNVLKITTSLKTTEIVFYATL